MTSKRTSTSESAAAGSAQAGMRKPRRTGSMHSVKPSAHVATAAESVTPIDTEAVAHLAYSFYEARGYVGGSPEEDWFRAERELMNR